MFIILVVSFTGLTRVKADNPHKRFIDHINVMLKKPFSCHRNTEGTSVRSSRDR
jgi:hypothetical protein